LEGKKTKGTVGTIRRRRAQGETKGGEDLKEDERSVERSIYKEVREGGGKGPSLSEKGKSLRSEVPQRGSANGNSKNKRDWGGRKESA